MKTVLMSVAGTLTTLAVVFFLWRFAKSVGHEEALKDLVYRSLSAGEKHHRIHRQWGSVYITCPHSDSVVCYYLPDRAD